jgi:hypothetical protein
MFRNRHTTQSPATRTRLGVHQLEDREVPAVDLLSALGVGSDTGTSWALDVAADAAGNSYLAGFFSGTTDFDPAHTYPGDTDVLTSRGGQDAYVAKYAPDGSLVWVRRMGGAAGDDTVRSVAVDGSGNVVVTGYRRGTGDFGPATLTSLGGQDGFVARLSPAGQVLWARRWGAANDEAGYGVGVDAAGNVYALGERRGSVVWTSGYDILKFGPSGSPLWTRSVDTPYHYAGNLNSDGLAVDAVGNVYAAGTFAGYVNFNPEKGKDQFRYSAHEAAFVLKLTTAGKFGWVSTFTSLSDGSSYGGSRATGVALDGGGNVFVGGSYWGPVDFNPGSGTTTLPAAGGGFIAKLATTNGALVWARALENTVSSSTGFPLGLTTDAAGNVYATGLFNGTIDFDPGAGSWLATAPGVGAFVLKLTADGAFGWAATFGGTGGESGNARGRGIAVDLSGTIYLAGDFSRTVDFDPDPLGTYELTTPGPNNNSFLVRLRQS